MIRYCPDRSFPPYAFVPGKNKHPEKEGGHMQGQELEVSPLSKSENECLANLDYLFAIDLYNNFFYWESHVYWEALWHKAGRRGTTADFLKALIKLAAAGVKYNMGQIDLAVLHLERAVELLSKLEAQNTYCGIDTLEVIEKTVKIINKPSEFKELKICLKNFA